MTSEQRGLADIAAAALGIEGVASAVIFVARSDAAGLELELEAAAGIDGGPLDRLVAAVRDPSHPIPRTAADGSATVNVTPTAPGGPALRSHLPILADGGARVLGVLAVAHEPPIEGKARVRLELLARDAGSIIARKAAETGQAGRHAREG